MGMLKLTFVAAVGCAMAASAQAQQIRVIAANPQGSIFYSGSVAIGKLIDDRLKMQVRVQPMAGSSTYIPLLNNGEADFGALDARQQMRLVIPSATAMVVGLQLMFGGFLVALARSATDGPGS